MPKQRRRTFTSETEFVNQMNSQNLRHLELKLYDYVNWFNKHRIHETLDYMTPVQYRQEALKKLSDLLLTIHLWSTAGSIFNCPVLASTRGCSCD